MEAPGELRMAANEREDIVIAQRSYDDSSVVTVDFGPEVELSLDVVDETAIVVAGDRQFEFEVPDWAADVTVNDGMLTITESKNDDE